MKTTNTILDKIVEYNIIELELRKKELPLSEIKKQLGKKKIKKRDFKNALKKKNKISLIAEIKKASPSLGVIKDNIDHVELAKEYEKAGASAISVLTDKKFFQGELSYIQDIKDATKLPILRKDFIFDEYQVYESKLCGADAILLITSILTKQDLMHLLKVAKKLNLDCLVETHSYLELETALECNAEFIGINNRDLKTFEVNINNFVNLARFVPKEKILVCESGIFTRSDVMKVKTAGADVILVGTCIMTSNNIQKKIMELIV